VRYVAGDMTRKFLATTACLTLAIGCTPTPPAELTDADRDAIRQYFDEVARNLSPEDNEAWANGFTTNAVFMFENTPPIRGRQSIRAWGEGPSGVVLSASFSDTEIHGSGDWAWVTTSTTVTVEGIEEPVATKQLFVLERQSDGTWLAAAVHASSNTPRPGN